jgi:phosphoribosylformylglycinamidine synthase
MRFGVVVFPGSNCDHDAWYAASHLLGQSAEMLWHNDTSLKGSDCVILPGGFSLATTSAVELSPSFPRSCPQ